MGIIQHLAGRFVRQHGGRVRVPRIIEREVRNHARPGGATEREQRKAAAATAIVAAFFLGKSRFPQPELSTEDLPTVERIMEALKNLPGGMNKTHGGEAELIALAAREQKATGTRQVLLSNDGGASVVAARYQIPTRHAADVLAEFACADPGLSPTECTALFRSACEISAPPVVSRPADDSAFTCSHANGLCGPCDNAE
ncbi:hypothetical protein [Nonomuraea sp. NPDC003709]|uniref:hypothetical protein n=1 Tax=Nonomuraea sp. NPDC003709 TaxID=3154450 RepID=UPI0033B20DF5